MVETDGSTSVPVYCCPITRDALAKLPVKTRRVYLLAGHIANEINELHRLAIFSLKDRGNRIMNVIGHGRSWVILRVLIGKTFEGFEFVRESLKETSDFYQQYLMPGVDTDGKETGLEPEGQQAYAKVQARIDAKRGLLRAIRNNYTFHYELRSYLDVGFDGLDASWDTAMYSGGEKRHGAFHGASEHVVIRAMLSEVGEGDLGKAVGQLANEATDAAAELNDLMEGVMVAILKKHDLMEGGAGYEALRVSGLPRMLEFDIPPICAN
jgi:hypothetical protein